MKDNLKTIEKQIILDFKIMKENIIWKYEILIGNWDNLLIKSNENNENK